MIDETKRPDGEGTEGTPSVSPTEAVSTPPPAEQPQAKIEYGFGTIEEEPEAPVDNDDRFAAFSQPVWQDKATKPRRISKHILTLVLSSVAMVLLAAAVVVVTLFPFWETPVSSTGSSTDSSTDTSAPDKSQTLLDKTVEDENVTEIKQIAIKNDTGSYTIVYNETDKMYQLKGYEDLTLDDYGVSSLTDGMIQITATDKVESPDETSVYGLDKPVATVTATYHDDTTATLSIGNKLPSEEGYYVTLDGQEGIYMISSTVADTYFAAATMYVDTTLIVSPTVKTDDANGSAILREVTLSGRSHTTPLTLRRKVDSDPSEFTYYSYIITAPYKRGTADSVSTELSSFTSLTASQAIVLHPTAEDKKKAGFDDPLTVMKLTLCVETTTDVENEEETSTVTEFYNTIKTTVTIGSKDESGDYLVMVDGVDAIFLVNSSSLSAVAERTYSNSVTRLLFLKDITEVSKVEIAINGQNNVLSLTHKPEEEDRDNTLVVTQGEKTYSTPDFRSIYTLMMSIYREDTLEAEPSGELELSLKLTDNDGRIYFSADFFAASGSLYHARTSEGETFTVKASTITKFIKQMDNLLEGREVIDD